MPAQTQTAACIGREFNYDLLAGVAQIGDGELRQALAQLAEAELVFQRGTPPEARYTFKHALVRDAAYESLLISKRRTLHARIAANLEQHFPQTVNNEPELLARHYTQAGLSDPAVRYWYRAGQQASDRSAYAEAITHLRYGLDALQNLADTRGHLAPLPDTLGTMVYLPRAR